MSDYLFTFPQSNNCQKKLQVLLDAEEHASRTETTAEDLHRQRAVRQRMDIDDTDIVVAGANPIRISRKQVGLQCLNNFLVSALDFS